MRHMPIIFNSLGKLAGSNVLFNISVNVSEQLFSNAFKIFCGLSLNVLVFFALRLNSDKGVSLTERMQAFWYFKVTFLTGLDNSFMPSVKY